MQNLLIKYLNILPLSFSNNELAFYCLTNKCETLLRDKVSFLIQADNPNFNIIREYNAKWDCKGKKRPKQIDMSIIENETIKALVEFKFSYVGLLFKSTNVKEYKILNGLKYDHKKCSNYNKYWHGVYFLVRTKDIVSKEYKDQVKKFKDLNKYSNYFKSDKQYIEKIKSMILEHNYFTKKNFSIKCNTLHVGSWFETPVDLIWILISTR